jgi:protein tyrosine phosphatase (PTP) superfamily phosphohydrolase (DUF442 family)
MHPEIFNFVEISQDISTAGQPSEDQLRGIAGEGVEAVINLGLLDPRYCLKDEAGLATSLGMGYIHIPVDFQAPTMEDLERFFRAMDRLKGKKVLIHCAANFRVSSFFSLYAQARLGWTLKEADDHIHSVWEPDDVWAGFIKKVRQKLFDLA